MTTRKCSLCKLDKPITDFYKCNQYYYSQCKECKREKDKNTYHTNNADKTRRIANDKRSRKIRNLKAKIHVYGILSQSKCVDCGESRLETLDFDHVRGTKQKNISYMILKGVSTKLLDDEISKCEVRCANCHRVKTFEQLGWSRSNWSSDLAELEMNELLAEPRKRKANA